MIALSLFAGPVSDFLERVMIVFGILVFVAAMAFVGKLDVQDINHQHEPCSNAQERNCRR